MVSTPDSESANVSSILTPSAKSPGPAIISRDQYIKDNWYGWSISDRAMYYGQAGNEITEEWAEEQAGERWDDCYMSCRYELVDLDFIRTWVADRHGLQRYCCHKNCLNTACPPYSVHLCAVERLVAEAVGTSPINRPCIELRIAALLHDVLEDTDCTEEQLRELGVLEESIRLVKLVTNPKEGNRKEKHAKTYPAIRKSFGAMVVKLSDRCINLMQSHINCPDLLKMYRREDQSFCEYLYDHASSKPIRQLWGMYRALIDGGK